MRWVVQLENWIVGITTGVISGLVSGWLIYIITKRREEKKRKILFLIKFQREAAFGLANFSWLIANLLMGIEVKRSDFASSILNLPLVPSQQEVKHDKILRAQFMKLHDFKMKIMNELESININTPSEELNKIANEAIDLQNYFMLEFELFRK